MLPERSERSLTHIFLNVMLSFLCCFYLCAKWCEALFLCKKIKNYKNCIAASILTTFFNFSKSSKIFCVNLRPISETYWCRWYFEAWIKFILTRLDMTISDKLFWKSNSFEKYFHFFCLSWKATRSIKCSQKNVKGLSNLAITKDSRGA